MRTGGDQEAEPRQAPSHPELPPPCSPRFVCKNNGVLFENQLLQIGVKSEFRQNLGMCGAVRMGIQRDLARVWSRD